MADKDGDRPSQHGAILGDLLANLTEEGRKATGAFDVEICATCAFRRGSMPNQTAGTALAAFNTLLGVDPDHFACHHGMKDGRPTKLCAGHFIAKKAPWPIVKAEMEAMKARLDAMPEVDSIRMEFDAWAADADPSGSMDVYQLARAWHRHRMIVDPAEAGRAALARSIPAQGDGT